MVALSPGARRSLPRYQVICGGGNAVNWAQSCSESPRRTWTLSGNKSWITGGSIRARDDSVHGAVRSSSLRGLLCPRVVSSLTSKLSEENSTSGDCGTDSAVDIVVHRVSLLSLQRGLACPHVTSECCGGIVTPEDRETVSVDTVVHSSCCL